MLAESSLLDFYFRRVLICQTSSTDPVLSPRSGKV